MNETHPKFPFGVGLLSLLKMPLTILVLILVTMSGVAENLESLVKKVGPAVVVFKDADGDAFGSGVLVSADGTVLTADHLFDDGEAFTVSLPGGRTLPVKRFLYRNSELDLAALEVDGRNLPFVTMGNPEKIGVGAAVIAIGNPRGLENTVSQGILSGKREIAEAKYFLQTSAPISPGSSGGGLFDEQGRLLAITVSYLENSQNLNFAVPIHYADLTAIKNLDKKIAKAPAKVDGYVERASAYFHLREFDLALVDLRQALQLDSKNPDAYWLRGEIYYWQQRYPDALQDYSTVIRLKPKDPQAYYDRGHAYLSLEKYEEAITDFRSAVGLNPDFEFAYSGLGRALSETDRDDAAAEAWTQAIRLDPTDASYYESRGECYFWCDKYELAVADFVKAVELDDSRPKPYRITSRICFAEKDFDSALKTINMAIDLEPGNPVNLVQRASVHAMLQNYEKALADIDRAIELGDSDAATFNLAGAIFYTLGRYDRAVLEYSKALEKDPQRLDVVKDRGDAYAALGDDTSARADYQYVIEHDASGEHAKEAKLELAKIKK